MAPTDPQEEDILEIIDQRRPPGSWVKYVALGAVGVTAVVCAYLFFRHFTPREFAGAVTSPMEKGVAMSGRFLDYLGRFLTTANVSTQSSIEVGRVAALDRSGPLIVAQQDLLLRFTNVDEHIFGTSSAEVRARAKAYYYVPLLGADGVWRIDTTEKDGVRVCIVHAPAPRPLTPINLDTRDLEIRTNTGALRSNDREMTQAALADITPRLNHEALARAADARGAARKTIAAFVKTWLVQDRSWGRSKVNAIQVLFPGETGIDTEFAIPGFFADQAESNP